MKITNQEEYVDSLRKLKCELAIATRNKDFSAFDALASTISEYEGRSLSLKEPLSPAEIISHKMDEYKIDVNDLASLYGTKQMIIDVLNERRSLSLNMIINYGTILEIPSIALINNYYYYSFSNTEA